MKLINVAALVLATLALSACATGDPVPSESAAVSSAPVQAPEPAASGDEADALTLPDDFPTDDVPLVEGELIVANGLSGGWSVWVASNDVANDFAAATELLVAVGFDNTVTNSDGESFFGTFSGEKYQVQVTAGDDPTYGTAVTYTIYPTE
jgi:hypothetical protein